jgi:hypothetical protein
VTLLAQTMLLVASFLFFAPLNKTYEMDHRTKIEYLELRDKRESTRESKRKRGTLEVKKSFLPVPWKVTLLSGTDVSNAIFSDFPSTPL